MPDRERYDGPLRAGMVITGRDNDGMLGFRRDLLLGPHPFKPGIWIYEALPCRMRRHIDSGVGEIGTCPELNIRMIMQPEESDGATEAPGPLLDTPHPEVRSVAAEQLGREGMVTVWDAHGRIVGCMGVEAWLRALPASDPPAEPALKKEATTSG